MICYKDRTYCQYYTLCKNYDNCNALTLEVKEAADDFGLPISQFNDKPDCFKALGSDDE